jgi:hypothetical protein
LLRQVVQEKSTKLCQLQIQKLKVFERYREAIKAQREELVILRKDADMFERQMQEDMQL